MKTKEAAKSMKLFNANDVLIAVLIIMLSFLPLTLKAKAEESSGKALLYQSDKVIAEIALDKDATVKEGPVTIEVSKGRIRFADAVCPNHVCVHSGFISQPGQSIVCLPNKIFVEIPAGNGNNGYDSVSW